MIILQNRPSLRNGAGVERADSMSVFVPLDAREVHPVTSHGSTIAVHLTPGDVGILLPGTLHAGGVNKFGRHVIVFLCRYHRHRHQKPFGREAVCEQHTHTGPVQLVYGAL
jgi:hypothetical protein